jgi:hypothetical protein
MTVFDEIDNIDQHDQMKFVEFLEFLCRVAYYNFELENWPLTRKLEIVLDVVLSWIRLQRKEPLIETVMDSDADDSDSDY